MAGNRWVGVRMRCWTALVLALVAGFASKPAIAADCPGRPDALGTSRTLVVDPKAQTAAMLPAFLRYLRDNRYRVVHLVPASAPKDAAAADKK